MIIQAELAPQTIPRFNLQGIITLLISPGNQRGFLIGIPCRLSDGETGIKMNVALDGSIS